VIYDWENRWAIDEAQGPRNDGLKRYEETCKEHYCALWKRGVPVDVVNQEASLDSYRLVVAPMLYMVRQGVAERLTEFVRGGGTLVCTYMSGWVDGHDLCFTGGFPGPLKDLLGIWSEEIDALYPGERNSVVAEADNLLGLHGPYEARELCELVHLRGARSVATYGQDFYAGMPSLTVNELGPGHAWYMASRNDDRFLDDFYGALTRRLGLRRALAGDLPPGVSAAVRSDGARDFVFLMNFTTTAQVVDIGPDAREDLLQGGSASGRLELAPYGVRVLAAAAARR
jgi:beta-galactosidase